MKGKIINFSFQSNSGDIAADDGARYTFAGSEWKGEQNDVPKGGMCVDFIISGTEASSVYPGTEPPPIASIDGIDLRIFTSLFFLFTGFLLLLTIFRSMVNHINLDTGETTENIFAIAVFSLSILAFSTGHLFTKAPAFKLIRNLLKTNIVVISIVGMLFILLSLDIEEWNARMTKMALHLSFSLLVSYLCLRRLSNLPFSGDGYLIPADKNPKEYGVNEDSLIAVGFIAINGLFPTLVFQPVFGVALLFSIFFYSLFIISSSFFARDAIVINLLIAGVSSIFLWGEPILKDLHFLGESQTASTTVMAYFWLYTIFGSLVYFLVLKKYPTI